MMSIFWDETIKNVQHYRHSILAGICLFSVSCFVFLCVMPSSSISNLTQVSPTSISLLNHTTGSRLEVDARQEIKLTCIVTGGNPTPEIVWLRNSLPFQNSRVDVRVKGQNGLEDVVKSTISFKAEEDSTQQVYTCEGHHQTLNNFPLSASVILSVKQVKHCPKEWLYILDTCYLIKEEDVTYERAISVCNSLGGQLFEPRNQRENDLVLAAAQEKVNVTKDERGRVKDWVFFWIGINDLNSEGTFSYSSTNLPIHWSNWNENEPNDANGVEDCVHMYHGGDGKWNDLNCDDKSEFICEKEILN